MKEVMYDLNSMLIAGILFCSMAVVIELGYRLGRRDIAANSEQSLTQVNAIQASLLGILALLLGFTFSLALQRYDSRSQAVVEEANAIGTTYLRAQMLHPDVQQTTLTLLQDYVRLRIEAGQLSLAREEDRARFLATATELQQALWAQARLAVEKDPGPVTTGKFIDALNAMIDAFGIRDSALNRHVPEIVLFLLYTTFLMTGLIVGYASGGGGHRASFITYILVVLIVLLVFIIIDLDRPRRGLIEVSQESLLALEDQITSEANRIPSPTDPPRQ